jgi:predicted amidophosphoribosyltransferase
MNKTMNLCPACQSPFQGKKICPQCSADLTPLMTAIGRAFYLRCQARKALGQGQYQTARRFATQAQRLHRTARGEGLLNVSAIAQAVRVDSGL